VNDRRPHHPGHQACPSRTGDIALTRITRHFIEVAGRRVHYTRAGSGPPVMMLHASPCSAKVMALPQSVFAERFTAIALDTPGFGLSDPLPLAQPEITDFADALADTMDALGIARAATYGRHTGAGIGVEFARRHPDRCSMSLADGYPVFPTPYSQERLAEYLAPIVPRWDGGHLLWLWFRYRDQHVFWPWDKHDDAHRSDAEVPDDDFLHRGVLELLEAGDGYRIGYAAAFRHDGLDLLPDLRRPVCFGCRPGDSMMETLKLFPPSAWTETLPREPMEAAIAERALLERYPADEPAPPAPAPGAAAAGRTALTYINQLLLRSAGDAQDGPPLVVLHDIPGSTALLDPLILALGQRCRVLAFDLAGQGESVAEPGFVPDVTIWATQVWQALAMLGVAAVHLLGIETGSTVAAEMARQQPDRVLSLTLQSPPLLPAAQRSALAPVYAPSADPVWDGSHLTRVWHHLRDQELWFPWFDRRPRSARRHTLRIGAETLHLRARECLKQPRFYQSAWTAVLAYPLAETLAALPARPRIIAGVDDVFARFCADAMPADTRDPEALAHAILGGTA
jgi:pimeloyl-ACP methyl ester carboxylesterase